MNGALLIQKHAGISSFGIIKELQRQWFELIDPRKGSMPKMGHGGTLDPFATGLLIVLIGKSVKLAQYFLGSIKGYEGLIRFGETTLPGDPTAPISEYSDLVPVSLKQLQNLADQFRLDSYLQIPPMYSAKKRNGKPLYELARAGIEVERQPQVCHLYEFNISSYQNSKACFRLVCSAGTYVRTLAQDFARFSGSVAMLETLNRFSSGVFQSKDAWTLEEIQDALRAKKNWNELPCWVPFDRLLDGFDYAKITYEEHQSLVRGQQGVILNILSRVQPCPQTLFAKKDYVAIFHEESLVAVVHKNQKMWNLERVFI